MIGAARPCGKATLRRTERPFRGPSGDRAPPGTTIRRLRAPAHPMQSLHTLLLAALAALLPAALAALLPAALAALLPAALAAPVPAALAAHARAADDGEHGALAWFEGDFDAARALAEREGRMLFLDFFTPWCEWCVVLDRQAFSDPRSVAATSDVVCLALDSESESGRPLAERYAVVAYPTLVFLDPDGSPRDRIDGYVDAETFLRELARIERDEGTVGADERAVAADPQSLELRYALATRLRAFGDEAGYSAQRDAIAALDPEGTSAVWRRIVVDERRRAMQAILRDMAAEADTAPLRAFLADETLPEILFEGWLRVAELEDHLEQFSATDEEELGHRRLALDAYKRAWTHCPAERVAELGNRIAFYLWHDRDLLPPEDRVLALSIARRAAAAAPDDPDVLDTLACCLHAAGERAEALATIRRAIELEPDEPAWRERLEELARSTDE